MNSSQKLVIITGASGGLGLTLAQEFAGDTWQVIGTGRSEKPQGFPSTGEYHQFDASSANDAAAFWKLLGNKHPEAEICLVNNAGGYISGGLVEVAAEGYEKQMQSAYFTAVYMTRGLAEIYTTARIINIISSSALKPHKNNAAYGAAKAAEMHFFQSLQQEFSPAQYQIVNLYPKSIASHGPDPKAIDPRDLAKFIREQAQNESTYYLSDVTLLPRA
ncbi:short-chain dehydrogenase/reductase SDR [candidate division TM7 genomosp. GTL1]|nr:short-chain dehydrogenase/reductase SDR [candidate division TM7 genomosp. GTL1]